MKLVFYRKLPPNFQDYMRALIAIICFISLTTCSSSSNADENCQFLLDVTVNETVNLNFPQFIPLQSPANPVYIANAGNGGIIITNTGSGFAAFDAADPNVPFSECSVLTINGIIGESSCETVNKYSLLDGSPTENSELRCALRRYRVEQNGNILQIFN